MRAQKAVGQKKMLTTAPSAGRCDSRRWVAYDRCYRREALALKTLDWSVANARLYNEAFTGHARAIPRCSFCLQEDHASQACPRNPNRPWFGWFPDPTLANHTPQQGPPAPRPPQSMDICRRYNDGKCKQAAHSCRYSHRCTDCGGPHPRLHCPRGGNKGNVARPRSPIGQPRPLGHPSFPPQSGQNY